MRCPKCNSEVSNNVNICPHCGSNIVKNNGIRLSKSMKSKINAIDKSSLVGGTVSSGSFIKLTKKVPKKDIALKDYNNYIDYKEAKQRENARIQRRLNDKTVYKSPLVDRIVSMSSYDDKQDKVDRPAFINIVSVPKEKRRNRGNTFNVFAYVVVISLWLTAIYLIVNGTNLNYSFHEKKDGVVTENNSNTTVDDEMIQYDGVSKSGQKGLKGSEGVTSIVYDNQYLKQFTISNEKDVERLISTDSVKQKDRCPTSIVNIENEIINNYGITAVNFCELDEDFARELANVVKYIYNEYPSARKYLTNLTLANVDKNQSFIAAFMPIFTFATSNTASGYPVAIKTQIILNAKYFLNDSKIRSSVSYGSKSGYFPPNATRSSTVAHEFGHYLSYVALLNYYGTKQLNFVKANNSELLYKVYDNFNEGQFSYNLLVEAYGIYKKEYPDVSFEQFRRSISGYAVTKDESGAYIYDETIAEAFHDVYLNGSGAKYASRCILKVLIQKL